MSQWEVTKYGQLIDLSSIKLNGVAIIRTRMYKYQDKYFIEVWNNDYCVHFGEVID